MMNHILTHIVTRTFDTAVGKGHRMKPGHDCKKDSVPAMHVGWSISPFEKSQQDENGERAFQHKTVHMIICGPSNYVYVAIQEDIIDMAGDQHIGDMEIVGFHDSCWRDAVDRFIWENRHILLKARAQRGQMDWYDKIYLSAGEVKYLNRLGSWRRNCSGHEDEQPKELTGDNNPFKKRWK